MYAPILYRELAAAHSSELVRAASRARFDSRRGARGTVRRRAGRLLIDSAIASPPTSDPRAGPIAS